MFVIPSEPELRCYPELEATKPWQRENIRLFYAEVWHLVIMTGIEVREEQVITELAVF